MQLQHFTTPENALLIGLGGGLRVNLPAPEKNKPEQALQTMGQPVVWLTKEESNIATAADVAHFKKAYGDDFEQKIGEPMYGGPVCCTVEVERNRHLMRWVEFLRTTNEARERFQQQRDSFAALDAHTLILMHDGKGSVARAKGGMT